MKEAVHVSLLYQHFKGYLNFFCTKGILKIHMTIIQGLLEEKGTFLQTGASLESGYPCISDTGCLAENSL